MARESWLDRDGLRYQPTSPWPVELPVEDLGFPGVGVTGEGAVVVGEEVHPVAG
jgi:hypothetical protein